MKKLTLSPVVPVFYARIPKLLVMSILCGLFIGFSDEAFAQAESSKVGGSLYDIPKGPYIGADLALLRLDEELSTLKSQMLALNPGTQSYKIVEWKYVFYHSIRDRLVEGKGVRDAIVRGLGVYVTDMYGDAPESQKMQHKNAVVALLIL